MVTEYDLDALVYKVVHGAEEEFVADVTDTMITNLVDGTTNASARNTLEYMAAANRSELDTILMQYGPQISAEVQEHVTATLLELDARDATKLGLETLGKHFSQVAEQTGIGISEIIRRQNVALVEDAANSWYSIMGGILNTSNKGLEISGGTIEKAIMRVSDAGITTVDYKSGVSNQVDVAVKRHMRTQVNQAAGRMTMDRLNESGYDLVQTTAHFGARPEHAEWQGKAFCLSGTREIDGVVYPDFYHATGYGTVTGLCGANCRHHFDVYFPGISQLHTLPDTVNGMKSNEYYEATQRQRELERRIRATKRDIAALEKAGIGMESPDYVQKRLLLGKQQRELATFCADKGLVRQYARERAYGIGTQPQALKGSIDLRKNIVLPNGLQMSAHMGDRLIEREIAIKDVKDTIVNPQFQSDVKVDELGRSSYKIIGKNATITVNPSTSVVTTVWKTGTKTRKKYENGSP